MQPRRPRSRKERMSFTKAKHPITCKRVKLLTHMELLLLSLPRLPSFGGSDASRDSFPAPIMRASKRLSFLSVLESFPAIAAGKFSMLRPEISILFRNEGRARETGGGGPRGEMRHQWRQSRSPKIQISAPTRLQYRTTRDGLDEFVQRWLLRSRPALFTTLSCG